VQALKYSPGFKLLFLVQNHRAPRLYVGFPPDPDHFHAVLAEIGDQIPYSQKWRIGSPSTGFIISTFDYF